MSTTALAVSRSAALLEFQNLLSAVMLAMAPATEHFEVFRLLIAQVAIGLVVYFQPLCTSASVTTKIGTDESAVPNSLPLP